MWDSWLRILGAFTRLVTWEDFGNGLMKGLSA